MLTKSGLSTSLRASLLIREGLAYYLDKQIVGGLYFNDELLSSDPETPFTGNRTLTADSYIYWIGKGGYKITGDFIRNGYTLYYGGQVEGALYLNDEFLTYTSPYTATINLTEDSVLWFLGKTPSNFEIQSEINKNGYDLLIGLSGYFALRLNEEIIATSGSSYDEDITLTEDTIISVIGVLPSGYKITGNINKNGFNLEIRI